MGVQVPPGALLFTLNHRVLPLLWLLLAASPVLEASQVSLNGYYEGEFVADKGRMPTPWNLWNPKNYFELKFTIHPYSHLEAFTSLNLLSNANDARLYLNQFHLSLKTSRSEALLFSREDRFWMDAPLLHLIQTDRARDDNWGPKAEGFRGDFWNLAGFFGTGILYKFRTFRGEGYMARLGRNFGPQNYLAWVYLKKDWHVGPPPTYNEVTALQGQWHLGGATYFRLEAARSLHPQVRLAEPDPAWRLGSLDLRNWAVEAEIRYLTWHHFKLAGSVFAYGPNFTDEFSNRFNPSFDHEFDRRGFYAEAIYLLPYRAVNLIYKTRRFRTRYQHPVMLDHAYTTWWNYGEIYAEFIGGVNAKVSLDSWKDNLGTWNHFLFEVIGENRAMRVKLQYMIKDIGVNTHGREVEYSLGQRHLFGTELRVNLTPSLQFYGRAAWGLGTFRTWESVFFQLAYRRFQNTEVFLEYGEPGQTDGNLVQDWDFSDNPYVKPVDRLKVLVKFWF